MNNNNISPFGWLLITAVAATLLGQLFGGSGNSTSSSSSYAPSSSSSAERRYVEQRFKQEGYSSKDAATAADAILKFQRAQEAQRSR